VAKEQLKVYIDEGLNKQFRELIMDKYPVYEKGLLSHEVTQAIKSWIALHTSSQNTIVNLAPNPTPRVASVFIQVKNYLRLNFYENLTVGDEVPKSLFEKSIMAVRGSDPRTIEKWVKAFHKFHLIKPTRGSLWEIL